MAGRRSKQTWAGAGALVVALLAAYLNGGLEGVLGELVSRGRSEAVAPAPPQPSDARAPRPGDAPALRDEVRRIEEFFRSRISGEMVEAQGVVRATLPDDTKGSRHQRFLVELEGGHTLLVSHNIDLAPRIDALRRGDRIAFRGQYEWNEKGGVVHWTHHDPGGRRQGGWLRHQGDTYR